MSKNISHMLFSLLAKSIKDEAVRNWFPSMKINMLQDARTYISEPRNNTPVSSTVNSCNLEQWRAAMAREGGVPQFRPLSPSSSPFRFDYTS